jgi:DNA processing protein
MMMDDKDLYWIWLSLLPKIGPRRYSELLREFKKPNNIWTASKEELCNVNYINSALADIILDEKYKNDANYAIENIIKNEIDTVCMDDADYPEYLKCIIDPPLVLYVKGKLKSDEKCIAIVGSRRASSYGIRMADKIAYDLSCSGLTVVSGMASGIDSAAHNAALRRGNRTIGIMGCGLDIVYPYENRGLMKNIISSGAAVSEFLPGTPPLPQHFPMRNRIISGMSLGVVIVEANEKSGSLITANYALEQGREVYAIPGNLSSRNSLGTNKLIREGAKIVTNIEDILEEMRFDDIVNVDRNIEYRENSQNNMFSGLDENERKIANELYIEPLHIDKLTEKTGLSMQVINAYLVTMELKRLVRQSPGKIFELNDT